MKKIKIIFAALLILSVLNSFAQESSSPSAPADNSFKKGYFGGRYQYTVTSLDLKSQENGDVTTSFVLGHGAGGMFGYNFSKNFGLQTEVMYNALAQEYKYQDKTQRINLSYVNVPLLMVLNTNAASSVNLNVAAGPQVGINTGASIEATSGPSAGFDTVNAVLAVKKVDFGLAYGVGIDFLLGESLKLSFGYRGVQGLIDISDQSKSTTTNEYYILDRSHVRTNSGYAGLSVLF